MPIEITLQENLEGEDFFFCSFKLTSGEEIFSSAIERHGMIILDKPIRVAYRTEDGNVYLQFAALNPFSGDELTAISSERIVIANVLSKKYIDQYLKARNTIYRLSSEESDDSETDTDSEESSGDDDLPSSLSHSSHSKRILH